MAFRFKNASDWNIVSGRSLSAIPNNFQSVAFPPGAVAVPKEVPVKKRHV